MKTKGERIKSRRLELGLTQDQLAEAASVTYQAVQQWEADKSNPKGKRLDALSSALQCSKVWIEFGDEQHEPANVTEGPEIKGKFPLISWVAAGTWHEITEVHPSEASLFPCPVNCSERTFVLRVQGISMEPLFRDGDLIFIDPEAEWRHGSYVVARLDDQNEATFKQLIVEGGQKYLKPVNPNWPEQIIPINGNCTLVGPVVFSGRAF
ncbi:LexA family protein [Oceanimonas smirnovii]|uniref:LexA family protein n=1 Tax=Oceanimonas smirnovii TaxID=264574 RepID=UPI003FD57B19